jgi:CRISPR-associated endonuclease/helicase Cas3
MAILNEHDYLARTSPAQSYKEHVTGVISNTIKILENLNVPSNIKEIAYLSAMYHDLGKLHPLFQKRIRDGVTKYNHTELGAFYCFKQYELTKKDKWLWSGFVLFHHHVGMCNFDDFLITKLEMKQIGKRIYPQTITILNELKVTCTEEEMNEAILLHDSFIDIQWSNFGSIKEAEIEAIDLRMCLSILSESDHSDAARKIITGYENNIKATKRIKMLDDFISKFPQNSVRNQIRSAFYHKEKEYTKTNKFCNLPYYPGWGKLFMAFRKALSCCKKYKKRKIIYIAPYVSVLHKNGLSISNILNFKNNDVAVVSSIMEKQNFHLKSLESSLIVMSAKRFTDMLTENNPNGLVNFYKIATDCVFILDEYHTYFDTLPKFELFMKQITKLQEVYGNEFIFSSGTIKDPGVIFSNPKYDLEPVDYSICVNYEKQRVNNQIIQKPFDSHEDFLQHLYGKVINKSCLIVLNTKRIAYLLYKEAKKSSLNVYHLSNCMTKKHLMEKIKQIEKDLQEDKKPIVFSTALIECGYDIDFDIGFREFIDPLTFRQFSGRINREGSKPISDCLMFSFSEDCKAKFPTLDNYISKFEWCFRHNDLNEDIDYSAEFASGDFEKPKDLVKKENDKDMNEIKKVSCFTIIEKYNLFTEKKKTNDTCVGLYEKEKDCLLLNDFIEQKTRKKKKKDDEVYFVLTEKYDDETGIAKILYDFP